MKLICQDCHAESNAASGTAFCRACGLPYRFDVEGFIAADMKSTTLYSTCLGAYILSIVMLLIAIGTILIFEEPRFLVELHPEEYLPLQVIASFGVGFALLTLLPSYLIRKYIVYPKFKRFFAELNAGILIRE